jgi:Zn-dependent protease with chaperone function
MTLWRLWIVGQLDASIVAAVLFLAVQVFRDRLTARVRSAILLILLLRLILPPFIRSPWSEAFVDLPPLDLARTIAAGWLQADVAQSVFVLTTLVSIALLARLMWQLRVGPGYLIASTTTAPGWIQLRANALSGSATSPQVRMSRTDEGPFASGLRRPVIILPSSATDLDNAALDAALAHELAHHERHDLWWIAGVRALCAIVWFNPLAHVFGAALIAAREDGSDDWAIARTSMDPFVYARALLQSARLVTANRDPIAAGAHPMGRRLQRLLGGSANPDGRIGVAALVLIVIVAALGIPGAHMPTPSNDAARIVIVIRQ